MGSFFYFRTVSLIALFVLLVACTGTLPIQSPSLRTFPKTSVWRVLWNLDQARSIVLQAITCSDASNSTIRLILEKEGTVLLQMDASPLSVSARGPLGNWRGSVNHTPPLLRIWVAFALYQKGIKMENFHLLENPKMGNFMITASDGKESLQARILEHF